LPLDYAFIRAYQADASGNLRFRRSQRNFNPIMAMATRVTVVEVEEDILPVGAIDPDDVHTAGIFVHRLVRIPPPPEGWSPQRPDRLLDDELDPVHRRPPTRRAPTPPIHQAPHLFRLVPVARPAEMPLADPQELGLLNAAESPTPIPLQCLQTPRHPYLGSH